MGRENDYQMEQCPGINVPTNNINYGRNAVAQLMTPGGSAKNRFFSKFLSAKSQSVPLECHSAQHASCS